jgi:hypothetical protein
MLHLRRNRRNVSLVLDSQLPRRWTFLDTALAAVIAHVVHYRYVIHHGLVVDVVNVHYVDVHYGSVIEEMAVLPSTSLKAMSEVPEAISDAPVETDIDCPEALVKDKQPGVPTPPWRCPQKAWFGCRNPRSRHPVIVVVVRIPSPITRYPQKALVRTWGLLVYRQSRWRKRDGNRDLGCRGSDQWESQEYEKGNAKDLSHGPFPFLWRCGRACMTSRAKVRI